MVPAFRSLAAGPGVCRAISWPRARLVAQSLQHDRVDGVRPVDALLEVLLACPVLESVEPEDGEPGRDLPAQAVVDLHQLERVLSRTAPGGSRTPAELLERALVVVDAEVDEHVGQSGIPLLRPDDENRRRLLPAPVPPGLLGAVEAVQQAFR